MPSLVGISARLFPTFQCAARHTLRLFSSQNLKPARFAFGVNDQTTAPRNPSPISHFKDFGRVKDVVLTDLPLRGLVSIDDIRSVLELKVWEYKEAAF